MSDTMEMKIEIPADNDGFVLLRCPLCGEYFKIMPSDYEDDGVLELRCPNCGLISDNYVTEDVIELAMAMVQNYAMDLIHKEMKNLERKFKGGFITFKEEEKPKKAHESPIHATIESLIINSYRCCGRNAKIKPMLKIIGSYCPFCGVKEYGTE
jgi:uncharacterized C2H2 Zn-finger protein